MRAAAAFWAKARGLWSANEPGEAARRRMGMLPGVLCLLSLVLWLPVRRVVASREVTVAEDRRRLGLMRAQAAEVERLRAAGLSAREDLLTAVEGAALRRGLRPHLTSMTQDAGSGLQVTLQGAPFGLLIGWLQELTERGGIRVEKAAVEEASSAGLVDVRLVLR